MDSPYVLNLDFGLFPDPPNGEIPARASISTHGQGWIFYGMVFLLPVALYGAGRMRMRFRKTAGKTTQKTQQKEKNGYSQ